MELTRREFMKTTGAAVLAVAATGLLGGCGDTVISGTAEGLKSTAVLREIKMQVKSLSYGASNGVYYFMPEVRIYNGTAVGLELKPANGSFAIRLNGTTELTVNAESMKKLSTTTLEDGTTMKAVGTRTLNRGLYETGYICGKGTGAAKFKYVDVIFYPTASDKKAYLSCRINANEKGIESLIGI